MVRRTTNFSEGVDEEGKAFKSLSRGDKIYYVWSE